MILILGLTATLIYSGFILLLFFGWKQIPALELNNDFGFKTSIIIPVRNEEEHIVRLINSILKNSMVNEIEIIILDDHSTDNTGEVVQSKMNDCKFIKYEKLPESLCGKKSAITHGVSMAKGDLILCTDGDSVVGENWIDIHQRAFKEGGVLAFGPVKLFNENNSRWIDILNLELAGLVAMGAATLQLGKPTMINGCNYSFSKKVFLEVGGFHGNEHIPTGDDEFLLRKIYAKYPSKVQFLKSKDAFVLSESPKGLNEFFNQRKRWASKWSKHNDAFSWIAPVLMFLIYGLFILATLISIQLKNPIGLIIIGVKLMVDYLFLRSALKLKNDKLSILNFLLLQIIYPFYVVFFGVASNFGVYRWRGRNHSV